VTEDVSKQTDREKQLQEKFDLLSTKCSQSESLRQRLAETVEHLGPQAGPSTSRTFQPQEEEDDDNDEEEEEEEEEKEAEEEQVVQEEPEEVDEEDQQQQEEPEAEPVEEEPMEEDDYE